MLRNSFRYLRLKHVVGIWSNIRVSGNASFSGSKDLNFSRRPRKKLVHKLIKPGQLPEKSKLEPKEELFKPVFQDPVINIDANTSDVGEEIAGKLTKGDKAIVLKLFIMDKSIQMLAAQHGIEGNMFDIALQSFRKYCVESAHLPVEQHIVFRDLVQNVGHVTDLFPFFLSHCKTVFPHLDCMEDLQKISDLTEPSQWYPLARTLQRKIIFHAGPTNSGKTYHALKRFMESESGVYCGPLRLLAMEVFDKCNNANVACDLITGETRRYANDDEAPANHVACTVEMANLNQEYDVAVIDEIQMIGDLQRGWSWTRTLLGIAAKEVHVCGEETAIDLVKKMAETTGDIFEVRNYERLTSLTYLDQAVGNFDKVRPGDCIVCFSKKDIFKVLNVLVAKGHKCAVIYGDLPPGTKIMMSRKFNDPGDPCNILVATDAVGMGLNLAIKRVVFFSLVKYTLREDNTKAMDYLTTSQAQQIGGRAGRFRTQFEDGEVTTFWDKDLKHLHDIVKAEKSNLEKAGINPSAEMIEMFSYHLPKASLSNLLDIFVHVCKMDEMYFMCNLMQFKDLAQLIEHIPLPLRTRYTLCSSPLSVRKGLAQVMFVKIALRMSQGLPLSFDWLCQALGAPFSIPKSISELERLEGAFDVVDIYLWLSYRYPDMFVDPDEVRQLRVKLDTVIQTFLNRGRIAEKKRRKLDLSNVLDEISIDKEIDPELIQNNPLQMYTPKPKPKQEREKHKVFTDVYRELENMEREISENESKYTGEIRWNETADVKRVDSSDVKDIAQNRDQLEESFIMKDTTSDTDKTELESTTREGFFRRDQLEESFIMKDTTSDTDKTELESTTREGFFTKNTDLYNQLAGSYTIKTMFESKAKGMQTEDIEDRKEMKEHKQENVVEQDRKPITAKPGDVYTPEVDDIKAMALKYELDEEVFRRLLDSAKKIKNEKTQVKTETGMNAEEMDHLKNMLTSFKKEDLHWKRQQSKLKMEDEKFFRTLVHSYPRKYIRKRFNDFQLNAFEGLRGKHENSKHLSFSNRFAILSGRKKTNEGYYYGNAVAGSNGENKQYRKQVLVSELPERSAKHRDNASYSLNNTDTESELDIQSASETSDSCQNKHADTKGIEAAKDMSLEQKNIKNTEPDFTHVFYKRGESSAADKSLNESENKGTDNDRFKSLEEKLIKQGVLSKEIIEQLKDEWERNKDTV